MSDTQSKALNDNKDKPKYNEWSGIIGLWESYALRLGNPIQAKQILRECSFSWIAKAIGNDFIYGN